MTDHMPDSNPSQFLVTDAVHAALYRPTNNR